METLLPEYLATAIIFIVVAFKVWRKSYSTTLFAVAVSFAICLAKHVSLDSAALLLVSFVLVAMVRAILQQKHDVWIRGGLQ